MSGAPLPSELPAELSPWMWLLGTWVGVGTVQYPGHEGCRFGQEISIGTDGRPFLTYISRSWLLDEDGERVRPLDTESGFWRAKPDNGVELVLANAVGIAEIYTGFATITGLENAVITGARAQLTTSSVSLAPTAKEYLAAERLYGLVDGKLLWTMDMAAVGQPMSNHLADNLTKVTP